MTSVAQARSALRPRRAGIPIATSWLLGALCSPAPSAAPPPRVGPASVSIPSFTLTEARGSGRPLWRRWVDLDGDGRLDLIVVSGSSTAPGSLATERPDLLLAYLQVTPDFLDSRRILVYRQTAAGVVPWGGPLILPGDAAAVDLADVDGDGHPEILFAAGYRIYAFGLDAGAGAYAPGRRDLFDVATLAGHTRAFIPGARLVGEVIRGRMSDLLLPAPAGLQIHLRKGAGGYDARPDAVIRNPLRSVRFEEDQVRLDEPAPRIVDVDGDGVNDLLFRRGSEVAVVRGKGDGSFASEIGRLRLPGGDGGDAGKVWEGDQEDAAGPSSGLLAMGRDALVDIDGDGLLDFQRTSGGGLGADDEGPLSRKGEPLSEVRIYAGRPGPAFGPAPDRVIPLSRREKHEGVVARPVRVNADARSDLVLTRFAVGFFQVARAVMTKKIAISVTFESMLQRGDGSFAEPSGKPFETRILIDLRRGISGSPTSVRGDYDGDGVTDLVEFTDAPAMKLHLTTPEGNFPEEAAVSVPLPRAPDDGALLDIEDLDGDGRSDAAFFSLDGDGFVVTVARSGS